MSCDTLNKKYKLHECPNNYLFNNNECQEARTTIKNRYKRHGVSGSGRVGDYCSFNTDCLMVNIFFFLFYKIRFRECFAQLEFVLV